MVDNKADLDNAIAKRECQQFQSPERINFNPSLYWQCQGVGLVNSHPDTDLQYPRIVAAIAVNPVTNPVFKLCLFWYQKGLELNAYSLKLRTEIFYTSYIK